MKSLPTLEECMQAIRVLVKEKGHEDNLENFKDKILFALVELGEVADIWKKHGFKPYEDEAVHGITMIVDPKEKIAEELIDVIFYVLDAFGLMYRDLGIESPDEVFTKKLEKNMKRKFRYGRPETKKG